jgi:uncharacterized radical SAM superfamily Fe-S cluster-containing enzyme
MTRRWRAPQEISPDKQCFGQFVPGKSKPLMAMVEITNRCNMTCPMCFADSNHSSHDVPISIIRKSLENLLEVTHTPIPIQISGGEPTLRQDLPEIISLAASLGFRRIELITNGIKISKTPELLHNLKEKGLTSVYLQFDGLSKETHIKIRGKNLMDVRDNAIEASRQAGLCVTLAVSVIRGINEKEIGDIVRYGIKNIDTVRAINFQSARRFTGRFELQRDYIGYDLHGLIKLIEEETSLPENTFQSKIVGHPLCNAMSYVFVTKGRMEPLFKYIKWEDILDFMGDQRREKLLDLLSGKEEFFLRHLANPRGWKLIGKAASIFNNNPLNVLKTKHILLFAKSFTEYESLNSDRINECCYAIATADGVFSFCAFNNLYRFPKRTRLYREKLEKQIGIRD